jgi:hypothetical protein
MDFRKDPRSIIHASSNRKFPYYLRWPMANLTISEK